MKVRQLFISPGHNFFGRHGAAARRTSATIEVAEIECVAGRGICGDRFFDFKENYKGQATFFLLGDFSALCAELKLSGKSPGESRRNIVVEGVDLNSLVGQEFEIARREIPRHGGMFALPLDGSRLRAGRGALFAAARRAARKNSHQRQTARPDMRLTRVVHTSHQRPTDRSAGFQPALGERTRKAGDMPVLHVREQEKFSAVILAGGKSSRMGRDKAFLKVDGQTLLARQIATARAAGAEEIFISGRADGGYSGFGLRVLRDEFPDSGPLAGIHAALATGQYRLLLALAVDLPRLPPDLLRKIFTATRGSRGAIPRWNEHLEPLAAFYPKAACPLCAKALAGGFNSARDFSRHCVESGLAAFVDLPATDGIFFTNCNSPDDIRLSV